MATRVPGSRGMMWSVFLISGLFVGPETVWAQAAITQRPPLSQACQAMQAHIADLLNQHRLSDDLDDAAFDSVMRLFYEAESACTLGRFSDGLDLYSTIPIGRVSRRQLR